MMKIVLVPGSFNPVTNAHFEMAEAAVRLVSADILVFIPANDKYLERKNCKIIPGEVRGDLILQTIKERASKAPIRRCGVDFREVDGTLDGLTYHTVQAYQEAYPGAEIYVVLGMDNLEELTSWNSWEEFVKNTKFIFCSRENSSNDIPYRMLEYVDNFNFIFIKPNSISSTLVRSLAEQKEYDKIREITSEAVTRYMEEKYEYI